ncbi:MAG: RraA family protein, partial [Hyphomicrobiales bacterium]|nr:RraA family protein [Hyphomicrobiales bacterium]
MTSLNENLQAALAAVDTPTICNAIEVVQGRRGYDRFTRATVLCSDPDHGPILGYVKTARIRSVKPAEEPAEKSRERRIDYYRYVSQPPRPAVVIIEDEDGLESTGAFWGEVNTTVHKGLGLSGVVTNGLMRDLGDLAPGFPLIAAAVGPS